MKHLDSYLTQLRSWLLRAAELMSLVLVVLILVYLLLGEASGDYVVSVMTNVSLLISAVTPQAIIGVALIAAVVAYLRR
ncbi:hypothetical protein N9R74_00240 [bacterium]|jgi:hypothetical protein|uniref:Uncharacterized protein n=1 Tax=Planktomarina temperata RCA23 TaxID=666509 RepID=A0AAN0RKT9_9RHOB|nr:hypothetical protein RCA23_c25450 [Planktomarina temperata RCA23]MBL6849989.1 hypothetical protein [Planktomarina temperata]MBT4234687.1 hypothetical protein [Marinovum sp.]MDA9345276.1 hypothetical protein [bacterium]MDC3222470.1 hypothetical protein [Planktomarina sp.]MDP4062116.1 hypothetical protein [Rhodobacteraceae bacterium LE17]